MLVPKRKKGEIWRGMPAKRFNAIADYLLWLQKVLNLQEWQLELSHVHSLDENALAEVSPTEGRKVATISLARDLLERDWEAISHTLIHEMLHLHHRDASEALRTIGPLGLMAQATYEAVWEHHRLHTEIMVDQMATAFADLIDDDYYMNLIKPEEN